MDNKIISRLFELAVVAAMFTTMRFSGPIDPIGLLLYFLITYVAAIFAYSFGFFLFEQLGLSELVTCRKSGFSTFVWFLLILCVILFVSYIIVAAQPLD